jgi:hypothetical protein
MISTAVQSTLETIIANTCMVMGDEEIQCPYCVHKEEIAPVYLKEGVVGYSVNCEVVIIETTPEEVEILAVAVLSAMLALSGTTVESTTIDSVTHEGDSPDFDTDSKLYLNILRFTIETSNR